MLRQSHNIVGEITAYCGNGLAMVVDGNATECSFKSISAAGWLEEEMIVVYDEGLFRVVTLQRESGKPYRLVLDSAFILVCIIIFLCHIIYNYYNNYNIIYYDAT